MHILHINEQGSSIVSAARQHNKLETKSSPSSRPELDPESLLSLDASCKLALQLVLVPRSANLVRDCGYWYPKLLVFSIFSTTGFTLFSCVVSVSFRATRRSEFSSSLPRSLDISPAVVLYLGTAESLLDFVVLGDPPSRWQVGGKRGQ